MYIDTNVRACLGLYSCGIVEKPEGCMAKKAMANVDELTYEILSPLTFPF